MSGYIPLHSLTMLRASSGSACSFIPVYRARISKALFSSKALSTSTSCLAPTIQSIQSPFQYKEKQSQKFHPLKSIWWPEKNNKAHTTNRISEASISGGEKNTTVDVKHLQHCTIPDVIQNQQRSKKHKRKKEFVTAAAF